MPPESGPSGQIREARPELELGAWTVTEQSVRDYLKAVGDASPVYFQVGLAPPLALAAYGLGALLGRLEGEVPPGAIHSAQEVEAHRGLPFGESVRGVAYLEPSRRRGGMRFITARYSLKNGDDTEVLSGKSTVLVFEAGSPPTGSKETEGGDNRPGADPLSPGEKGGLQSSHLPVVARTITQDQLKAYARASGDYNPVHLDAEFAAAARFGGVIAHGMLTLAFIAEMMAVGFGQPWLETGALKVRFKGAAYLGDQLETWGRVTKEGGQERPRLVECSVGVRNRQSGQELVSGAATVAAGR